MQRDSPGTGTSLTCGNPIQCDASDEPGTDRKGAGGQPLCRVGRVGSGMYLHISEAVPESGYHEAAVLCVEWLRWPGALDDRG